MPTISAITSDNRLVELVYDPFERRTALAILRRRPMAYRGASRNADWRAPRPISGGDNTLIKHNVVLLPSEPEEYGTTAELVAEIHGHISTNMPICQSASKSSAAHYALFTWVHDRFNELPYLRLKRRFWHWQNAFSPHGRFRPARPSSPAALPASRRSSTCLDRFAGTLILDEADFRFSDASADITKILNNGNVKGFRCCAQNVEDGKEFCESFTLTGL